MTHPRRHIPPAFTLVEVLVALALMAMVLLASLSAQQRIQRQLAFSALRIQAVTALDSLLADWVTGNQWPSADTGPIPDLPNCTWRRISLSSSLPANTELVEVQAIQHTPQTPDSPPRILCRVQAFKSKN